MALCLRRQGAAQELVQAGHTSRSLVQAQPLAAERPPREGRPWSSLVGFPTLDQRQATQVLMRPQVLPRPQALSMSLEAVAQGQAQGQALAQALALALPQAQAPLPQAQAQPLAQGHRQGPALPVHQRPLQRPAQRPAQDP